ncbi:MAG: hypothetical protein HUU49_01155 [Candidatus Buchananbacteria bacterium]|nr:hypothetical protein [Candidatus Buchananbacteria bacterium]
MALKPSNKFVNPDQERLNPGETLSSGEVSGKEIKETGFEQAQEKPGFGSETEKPSFRQPAPNSIPASQAPAPIAELKSESLVKIEAILEEDLADAYFKMSATKQKEFKLEGEQIAKKIDQLLLKTKDEARNIFKLIFKWLRLMPGVNKFFVEQEAKIKTDKILRLKK